MHLTPRACLSLITLVVTSEAAGQEPRVPRFRHPDGVAQARRMLDSVVRLDEGVHATRRVYIDSANTGSFWLEFEPSVAGLPSCCDGERSSANLTCGLCRESVRSRIGRDGLTFGVGQIQQWSAPPPIRTAGRWVSSAWRAGRGPRCLDPKGIRRQVDERTPLP